MCFQSVPIHSTGSAQVWLSKNRSRGALDLCLHSIPYYRFHLLVTHRIRLPNTLRSTLQAESGRWAAPVFKTIESSSCNSNIVWNLYSVRSEECNICNQQHRPLVELCLTATTRPPPASDKITNLGVTSPNLRTSHASL